MTVEVTPGGTACNIACNYCYQNDLRSASLNKLPERDMQAMKTALMEHGQEFTVFGGEPLLTPLEDLEELFRFGYEQNDRSSIQTNGSLITDRHLEMFEKYNVHVGISVDGQGDLNDERRAGTIENTRRQTEKTHQAIRDCCDRGIPVSVIITLHRGNAGDEDKLSRMEEWFFELDDLGISAARLHSLEVDNQDVSRRLVLSSDELINALRRFGSLPLNNLRFDVFEDVDRLLTDRNASVTCTWQGKCDPLTTTAVQGVNPDGSSSNCGRTNKDGVNWLKADSTGFERGLALYQTPQEHGGCKGCRFFALCGGQCNGTGIDMDWRNRSDQCETWYSMFEEREAKLLRDGVTPVTMSGEIEAIERELIESWNSGRSHSGNSHGDTPHGDSHGDSDDPEWVKETGWTPND